MANARIWLEVWLLRFRAHVSAQINGVSFRDSYANFRR